VLILMPQQAQTLLSAAFAGIPVTLAACLFSRMDPRHATHNHTDRGPIGRKAVRAKPIIQGAGRLRFGDTSGVSRG